MLLWPLLVFPVAPQKERTPLDILRRPPHPSPSYDRRVPGSRGVGRSSGSFRLLSGIDLSPCHTDACERRTQRWLYLPPLRLGQPFPLVLSPRRLHPAGPSPTGNRHKPDDLVLRQGRVEAIA